MSNTADRTPHDPVRARRAKVARWNRLATRIGWACFGVAMGVFLAGVVTDFTDTVATVVIVAMAVGTVVLAPAIVIGYAVKAAERDDLERGL